MLKERKNKQIYCKAEKRKVLGLCIKL